VLLQTADGLITIEILKSGNEAAKTKIGIEAPATVRILREEKQPH
jgi:sRNA-binding carbon storage regulator CsrA